MRLSIEGEHDDAHHFVGVSSKSIMSYNFYTFYRFYKFCRLHKFYKFYNN